MTTSRSFSMPESLGSLGAFLFAFIYVYVFHTTTDDDIPWTQFSTKTAYRHCNLQSYVNPALSTSVENLGTCQLVHINALFRHGTRSPSTKDVKKFKDLYKRLLSSKGARLPRGFRAHRIPFENQGDKRLLPRGFEEHHQLGQMFRLRMNRQFILNASDVQFFSSSSQRARDSARSFYHGFFGIPPLDPRSSSADCGSDGELTSCLPAQQDPTREDAIHEADELLRFFDFCKRYRTEIENNKSSVLEHRLFREGPEVQRITKKVLKRNRLPESEFTSADVHTMYVACSYELAAATSSKAKRSPWCDFLRSYELPVFEYMSDLKHFWLKSYGYELNYVQSCPLIGEMIAQVRHAARLFKNANLSESAQPVPRASFWFGHAETLLPIVAQLGLFNDSVGEDKPYKLYADGFAQWQEKRLSNPAPPTMFRAGHIAPFAGNLALQLYYCPQAVTNTVDDPWSGFFVKPLVNDREVAWPLASPVQPPTKNAPGATFAPLNTVLNRMHSCLPETYEADKVCSLPDDSTTSKSPT